MFTISWAVLVYWLSGPALKSPVKGPPNKGRTGSPGAGREVARQPPPASKASSHSAQPHGARLGPGGKGEPGSEAPESAGGIEKWLILAKHIFRGGSPRMALHSGQRKLTIVFDTISKDQVHIIQEDFSVLVLVLGYILEEISGL